MTELQTTWGWLLAIDLFCSGLGAGAFIVVAILALTTGERFKRTVRFGAWASAIVIVVGVLTLLLDVGQPLRAIVLFRSFVHFDSWMTRGAWLLFSAIVINGLFSLFWTEPVLDRAGRFWKPLVTRRKIFRAVLAVVGIGVNAGVAAYTGILLGVLQFRPLWHTWFLPALFISSALLSGAILVGGFAALREEGEKVASLRRALAIVVVVMIIVEGAVLALYLGGMRSGPEDAVRSVELLTGGALGILFWVVAVALGLGLPLVAFASNLTGLRNKPVVALVWAGVIGGLAGAWVLRFSVLSAGLPQALASPVFQQILQGVKFIP